MSDKARAQWVREQLEHVATHVRADLRDLFGELKKKKRELSLPDGDLKVIEHLVRETLLGRG
jgi:hypothetical protein